MTSRLLRLLLTASLMILAVACQSDNASSGSGETTSTPAGEGATPTAAAATTASPTSVPTAVVTSTSTAVPTATPENADAGNAGAADADVLFVHAAKASGGSWTFRVTVTHPDTGWEDYADGWDIVTPDGTVLKPNPDDAFTRVLLHPHENEQPFTRSQRGIVIPEGVTTVTVRAHDSVDGFGGRKVQVDLTADAGPDFEVEGQP